MPLQLRLNPGLCPNHQIRSAEAAAVAAVGPAVGEQKVAAAENRERHTIIVG